MIGIIYIVLCFISGVMCIVLSDFKEHINLFQTGLLFNLTALAGMILYKIEMMDK